MNNPQGAKKGHQKRLERYGPDWYETIGREGGKKGGGNFNDPERARRAARSSWSPESRRKRRENALLRDLTLQNTYPENPDA